MFRLWGKIYKNNDIIEDKVFELDTKDMILDEKIKLAMESLCYDFDLQKPMWLSDNHDHMLHVGKTKFYEHHFIEQIKFDYFEIEIIENKDN